MSEKKTITVSFKCDEELYNEYKAALKKDLQNQYSRINVAADIKAYFRAVIESHKEKK